MWVRPPGGSFASRNRATIKCSKTHPSQVNVKRQDPEDEEEKLLNVATVETSKGKKIAGEGVEEEEGEAEDSAKIKWKDSLKIRRGKFKKPSLDLGSGEKVEHSWLGDEVDTKREF